MIRMVIKNLAACCLDISWLAAEYLRIPLLYLPVFEVSEMLALHPYVRLDGEELSRFEPVRQRDRTMNGT